MNPARAWALVQGKPDFIFSKRFNNSLAELKRRYPDETPDRIIAAVLMISEAEIKRLWNATVAELRAIIAPDSL